MKTRAGRQSGTRRDWVSKSDPSYVSLDHLLHHPDFAGWFTVNDRTMHFVCCFLLLLLSCIAVLLISHVYRPFSRPLHILLGFVVNTALYCPGYLRVSFRPSGPDHRR